MDKAKSRTSREAVKREETDVRNKVDLDQVGDRDEASGMLMQPEAGGETWVEARVRLHDNAFSVVRIRKSDPRVVLARPWPAVWRCEHVYLLL